MAVKLVYELARPGDQISEDVANNINIAALIDEVVDQLGAEFNVPIKVANTHQGMTVLAQRSALRLSLENIVRNACQYCESHKIKEGVRVSVASDGSRFKISIKNQGDLPAEFMSGGEHAFTNKTGGLGLGVFIARHLLERMQGELLIEQDGQDVVVVLTLQAGVIHEL